MDNFEEYEQNMFSKISARGSIISVLSLYNATAKDSFISNLAYIMAKKTQEKILLIDFESPFPMLDHFFNIDKYIYINELHSTQRLTGVSGALTALHKGYLNSQTFKQFASPVNGFQNLSLMTGLFDIGMFEDFELEDIQQIINCASQNYTTVLISLNSFIFNVFTYASILQADKTILLNEPSLANGRANINLIKQFTTVQKMPIQNFFILMWGNGMDIEMQNRLFEGYNVLGAIPDNKDYMKALLNKKLLLTMPNTQKDMRNYLNVLQNLGYISKERRFHQILHTFKHLDPYADDDSDDNEDY